MKTRKPGKTAAGFFSLPPKDLFLAILAIYPAFLFQSNAALAFGEALIFFLAAAYKAGRLRVVTSVAMFLGIAGFNLLTPIGRVLFRVGDFPITLGALLLGIRKASILSGMVQLSKIAVDKNLRIPGKFGEFTELVFEYFQSIIAEAPALRGGDLLGRLDDHLALVYNRQEADPAFHEEASAGPPGIKDFLRHRAILVTIVAFFWILLPLGKILPPLG